MKDPRCEGRTVAIGMLVEEPRLGDFWAWGGLGCE